jgi:hypothetical protein
MLSSLEASHQSAAIKQFHAIFLFGDNQAASFCSTAIKQRHFSLFSSLLRFTRYLFVEIGYLFVAMRRCGRIAVELSWLVSVFRRSFSPMRGRRSAMFYKHKDWQPCDCRVGCSLALLEENPGAMNMFSTKAVLAAAAIFSFTMIESAAALPADNLASTAKASTEVQHVQWGFRGGRWGGGWRGGGWGWRGGWRGVGWRGGWRGVGWRGVGWRGGWGWRRPVAWGWRRPIAWGWRHPVAWGWRRPIAWGWRRPLYGFAGGWRGVGWRGGWGWRGAGWRGVGWRGVGWRGGGWRGGGWGWRGGWRGRRW